MADLGGVPGVPEPPYLQVKYFCEYFHYSNQMYFCLRYTLLTSKFAYSSQMTRLCRCVLLWVCLTDTCQISGKY